MREKGIPFISSPVCGKPLCGLRKGEGGGRDNETESCSLEEGRGEGLNGEELTRCFHRLYIQKRLIAQTFPEGGGGNGNSFQVAYIESGDKFS